MIRRVTKFAFDNSLLLIAGAVAALVWANLDPAGYKHLLHLPLLANPYIGVAADGGGKVIDLHFLVNDILMAFFFAMAGREVWDAVMPGGALSSPRKAATPMICAVGGMAVPAAIFLAGAAAFGRWDDIHRGWAIPTATDIAFSYMVARMIFGGGHPGVMFLLLLAIVDDALGLVVLAVFYPQGTVAPAWLLLSLAAMGLCVVLWMFRVRNFVWYVLGPGALSWWGFAMAGLHPALGLLPIVPMLPHVHIVKFNPGWDFVSPADAAQFAWWLKRPVEVVLGLFGLFNAGVPLAIPGGGQIIVLLLVLCGLLVGKPIGIFLTAVVSTKLLGLQLGDGLRLRDMVAVGCVAGIGFTVALFVVTASFGIGNATDQAKLEAAKLGALLSFLAAPIGLVVARLLGVRRMGPRTQAPLEVPNA